MGATISDAELSRPPARSSFVWRMIAWCIGSIAVVVLVVAGVRWLSSVKPASPEDVDTSLEAQWDSTIRRLGIGIEPVYPPEEDLSVGDVFATVVADDQRFPSEGPARIVSSTPFLGKSVKIGHVDVAKELAEVYAGTPLFPETSSRPQGSAGGGGNAGSGSAPSAPVDLFGRHAARTDLPRAAFPGLTIYHTGSAAAGAAPAKHGWFDFGAANQSSQKLVLGAVETYGLDAVTADAALTRYCNAAETKVRCTEDVVRRQLRSVVGDHVLDKFVDNAAHDFRYSVTVSVVMVSRVYLAREILEEWSTSGAEGGAAQVALKTSSPASAPEPTSGGDTPGASVERRVGDVEKQLANLQQGGALVYRTAAGTDILLDQKFPRPVAVGYRSVSYDFPSTSTKQPN
jgi:hypothetical protein